MLTEGYKTDSLSSSKDAAVSESFQQLGSPQSIAVKVTKEEIPSADLVESKSTSDDTFALDEVSGTVTNTDNHTSKKSADPATTNQTQKWNDASIASSGNEETGDSGTSFVEIREPRIRKVTFSFPVFEENDGTSRDLTTPARVVGDRSVNNGSCPEHCSFIGYIRIKMTHFRESRYFLLLQIVLLALSLTTGFVGVQNIFRCPASPGVAILFFMMGTIGTLILIARIFTDFTKKVLLTNSSGKDPSDGLFNGGLLLLVILFATEAAFFFTMDPEFTPTRSSAKYCDAKFYSFAKWMTYLGVALIILIILVHSLRCIRTHVTRELIGRLDD